MSRWVIYLPVLIFAGLAGIFLLQLTSGKDTSELPSVLIGREAPRLDLPPLPGLVADGMGVPGIAADDVASGKPAIVNIWASWCAPCRAEHPVLMALAQRDDVSILGINYKDSDENALRFLGTLGNPFDAVGVDQSGRAVIDWGFYGVPETFLVNGTGQVIYKIVGPITQEKYDELLAKLDAL